MNGHVNSVDRRHGRRLLVALALFTTMSAKIHAEVVIETVSIGNPGNGGDLAGQSLGGHGPDAIVGGVAYVYEIGKFEITTGQYCQFLNAVAASDPNELYDPQMWTDPRGCKIEQIGTPGAYTYDVAADRASRPVTFIAWQDAARFANWLHNGQPTGAQDLNTTEDGSYLLTDDLVYTATRKKDATWVLPTEDEWYKATYHRNDGMTANYWDFPTATDELPSHDLIDPDPGNNANFYDAQFTIGPVYWRTEVGEFENSASPYGTFDQGGNVWEWLETIIEFGNRGLRGGSYNDTDFGLRASVRYSNESYEHVSFGFRVARVAVCDAFDGDSDLDIDLRDFAQLQLTEVHLDRFAVFHACLAGPDG